MLLMAQAKILKDLASFGAWTLQFGAAYGPKNYTEDSYIKQLIQLRTKFKFSSVVTSN